jgi:hypothetical protein
MPHLVPPAKGDFGQEIPLGFLYGPDIAATWDCPGRLVLDGGLDDHPHSGWFDFSVNGRKGENTLVLHWLRLLPGAQQQPVTTNQRLGNTI